jgi:uncharacterized protein YndB with AHSA1/START domain
MTPPEKKPGTRSLETEIEIDAPVDAVWNALTNPEELARWFPLEAQVVPGPGGTIQMSWGYVTVESNIVRWEPGRHLQTSNWEHAEANTDAAAGGQPAPGNSLVLDYFLESRGGKTVLRLVHSGFGTASDWDNEFFDGFRRGWAFELRGLRHYLERHRGRDRVAVCVRVPFAVSRETAWQRLVGADGFVREGSLNGLREGNPYSIRAANGDSFSGVVQVLEPGVLFSGTVAAMNDAFMRLELERWSGEPTVILWVSTYGWPAADAEAFETRWKRELPRILA